MSMHPKGPLPKKQQQVQVDLKQADTIKCKSCGNYFNGLRIGQFKEFFKSGGTAIYNY